MFFKFVYCSFNTVDYVCDLYLKRIIMNFFGYYIN